jgi:membrane protein YdbS with pleckstrin-like domain
MWDVTEWAVVTWLKCTLVLAAAVGAGWLYFGAGSGAFTLVCLAAVVAELYTTRQLAREWAHEAGLRWWWSG